jgi:hypothetical protein
MIVLIPSYKRTEILHWVIQSVVQCDTQGIDERILILIVNNYYPNREEIDSVVSGFRFEGHFQCEIIHREKTLPAIESWFSAMFSKAAENEVVILLGDDDILLPWGLSSRYRAISKQKADMLISNFCQRMYFFDRGEKYWADFRMPAAPTGGGQALPWVYEPSQHARLTFVSNHCYRNTAGFRKGLETAVGWCKAQNWVPVECATGNLPGYLPFAIKQSGGSVISTDEVTVIRGSIVEETKYQEYSDAGNTSFYCLLIFNTFNNSTLHPDLSIYNETRHIHLRAFLSGVVGILTNNRISKRALWDTVRRSGISIQDMLTPELLNNWVSFAKMLPGIRGYRLKQVARNGHLATTREFILNLKKARGERKAILAATPRMHE